MTTKQEIHDIISGKKASLKEVDKIFGLTGTKRWRAAVDFAVKHNPGINIEHQAIVKEVKQLRDQQKNKFGTSGDGNSGLRSTVRVPASIYHVLEMFDPEAFNNTKGEDGKTLVRKLARTFPEYRIYEVV